jgi:tetratricopeptide (TPR) repeat protein
VELSEREGVALQNAGEHSGALGRFLEGVALADHPSLSEIKMRLFMYIGESYYHMDQVEKAVESYRNAFLLMPQVEDKILKVKAACNYAGIVISCEIEGKTDEAIEILEAVIELAGPFLKENDQPLLARAIEELTDGLLFRQAEGDFEKLVQYATEGAAIQLEDHDLKGTFLQIAGNCWVKQGDLLKAFHFYELAFNLQNWTDEGLFQIVKTEREAVLNQLLSQVEAKLKELMADDPNTRTPENYLAIAKLLSQAAIFFLKRKYHEDRDRAIEFLQVALKQPFKDETVRKAICTSLQNILKQ